ncbi:MAG TPA: hypothetical protein DCZ72_05660 [Armatimonadetes bacterium]|nr:hypothetical protein [Armatimonadota bacterium]
MTERVLCVPATLVAEASAGRAVWSAGAAADEAQLCAWLTAGKYRARAEAETNEAWRQVIPYVLLRAANGTYFTYRRLPASGESRLVGRHSLGVGGHLNDEFGAERYSYDANILRPNTFAAGVQRELDEELVWPADAPRGTLSLMGFLALSETPVDRVHVGAVLRLEVTAAARAAVDVRETDKLAAVGWLAPAELRALAGRVEFEGWTRALLDADLV